MGIYTMWREKVESIPVRISTENALAVYGKTVSTMLITENVWQALGIIHL